MKDIEEIRREIRLDELRQERIEARYREAMGDVALSRQLAAARDHFPCCGENRGGAHHPLCSYGSGSMGEAITEAERAIVRAEDELEAAEDEYLNAEWALEEAENERDEAYRRLGEERQHLAELTSSERATAA